MRQERIDLIKNAISNRNTGGEISVKYIVPWDDPIVINKGTIDMIFSHSVLEHVKDLENVYRSLSLWLKPNGLMSHQIDLTSHRLTERWNGHWAYSDLLWKITIGKRLCKINRQPCSKHITFIEKNGFEIIYFLKNSKSDGITRSQLSPHWKSITEEDLGCSGVFVQARKI